MRPKTKLVAAASAALVLLLAPSCQRGGGEHDGGDAQAGHEHGEEAVEAGESRVVAIAELAPLGGSGVKGRVVFTAYEDGVAVEADVTGLTPGDHGFHIHEIGNCDAPDGSSAGGHYNPEGHPHAGPTDPEAHAGDLGNLAADENGHATLEMMTNRITLGTGDANVVGRSVIVHEKADDLVSQPTGAAGGRLACGVILPEAGGE